MHAGWLSLNVFSFPFYMGAVLKGLDLLYLCVPRDVFHMEGRKEPVYVWCEPKKRWKTFMGQVAKLERCFQSFNLQSHQVQGFHG